MLNRLLVMIICCASFYSGPAMAAPDGADLLAACEYSLQHDFTGVKGKMCHWYVTPCDCNYGRQPLPRVCLPSSVAVETLARQTITGLRAKPALLSREADVAAAIVLSEHYPCPAND